MNDYGVARSLVGLVALEMRCAVSMCTYNDESEMVSNEAKAKKKQILILGIKKVFSIGYFVCVRIRRNLYHILIQPKYS